MGRDGEALAPPRKPLSYLNFRGIWKQKPLVPGA